MSPARSRLPILECPQPLLLLAVQAAGAHRQTAAADSITRLEAQAVHSQGELVPLPAGNDRPFTLHVTAGQLHVCNREALW